MRTGTPEISSPMTVPERTVYAPQPPRVLVSMIREVDNKLSSCIVLELIVKSVAVFKKDFLCLFFLNMKMF